MNEGLFKGRISRIHHGAVKDSWTSINSGLSSRSTAPTSSRRRPKIVASRTIHFRGGQSVFALREFLPPLNDHHQLSFKHGGNTPTYPSVFRRTRPLMCGACQCQVAPVQHSLRTRIQAGTLPAVHGAPTHAENSRRASFRRLFQGTVLLA